MLVEVTLLDKALLQTFSQRHKHLATLQVGTVEHSIDRGTQRVFMRLVLAFIIEIVDGVTVSKHDGIVTPLVAQDVDEQTVAGTTGLALKTLIGTHHLANIGFLDQCLEGRQIGLPQVTIGRFYIHGMAQGLRTTVYGIVLGTGMGLEILVVVALHTQYGLYSQHSIQIRILATCLLSTSPTRVTEDIDVRTPEGQLRIAWVVGHTLWHVEQLGVVVVSTVPVGTGLVRYLREDIIYQLFAESSSQTNGLRIDGIATLAHTVTSLTPPVIRRNTQTVDANALVHHQTHLLFRCQHSQQALYTLCTRQIRILPCILVLGTYRCRRKPCEHKESKNSFCFH